MTSPIMIGAKGPLFGENEQACVALLEEALEMARLGKVKSIGIIVCMESSLATVMAGPHAGDLYLGASNLQAKIHAAVFEDGNVKKRSGIVRG